MAKTIQERIEIKLQVDMLSGCHRYAGQHDADGYGLIKVTVVDEETGKRKQVTRRVHRVRWELEVGPIPPKHVLDHKIAGRPIDPGPCMYRDCCNIEHLEAVTISVNSKRVRSWNSAKTHCPQGHRYDPLYDADFNVLEDGHAVYRWRKDGRLRRDCRACGK